MCMNIELGGRVKNQQSMKQNEGEKKRNVSHATGENEFVSTFRLEARLTSVKLTRCSSSKGVTKVFTSSCFLGLLPSLTFFGAEFYEFASWKKIATSDCSPSLGECSCGHCCKTKLG
jgi:hypothetical protein